MWMKFFVPAITLFCLVRETVTVGFPNGVENFPSSVDDYRERRHEEPAKNSKRNVKDRRRGPSYKQFHQSGEIDSNVNPYEEGRRHSKTRRKSDQDNGDPVKNATITQIFRVDPDLTMMKGLGTESSREDGESADVSQKKRKHGQGRVAGRIKAACESCATYPNADCPSNIENMFICPKCRTHFIVKLNIKESKGCDS